jgi:xanthine dehydrogenase YagR molybdenum-binding subunit
MNKKNISPAALGDPMDRVDGRLKVTGAATYAAEYPLAQLTHAVLVSSKIARGTISQLDAKAAERAPGVLAVISHLNSPGVPGYGPVSQPATRAPVGTALRVFHDEHIYFYGQPVAMVIADTLERAVWAASLVKVQYAKAPHQTHFQAHQAQATLPQAVQRNSNSPYQDYVRGNPDAYLQAEVQMEATYTIPTEHHNPIEPHATIAVWEAADRLQVYDKTQAIVSTQASIARAFKLPPENVKVNSLFVGGAFGSGIRTWPHVIAAILGAKKVQRPVKLVLSRDLMFTSVGSRPYTVQHLKMGATRAGQLTAISHEGTGHTSTYEEHLERTILGSRTLYACPNVTTRYRLLQLDVNTPTWMRGPGEVSGIYALESAMDEMAYALQLDPLEFRLRNHADTDPERNLPWSTKFLKECYIQGARQFGWDKRKPAPGSMMAGGQQVGYGMASSLFGVHHNNAKARALLLANGRVIVQSATSDMGPGTGTAMVQIAAAALGVAPEKIRFDLGDSSLPQAPGQSGSVTISSVGSAVLLACEALKKKFIALATESPGSPLYQRLAEDLSVSDGRIFLTANTQVGLDYTRLLEINSLAQLEVLEEAKVSSNRDKYSMYAFGAHFVEVQVAPATGQIRVTRVVSCSDVGKIINHKTAGSQSIGGIVGGIGMALMEESVMDHRFGAYLTNNLGAYHVPVNADIPQVETLFIDRQDALVNAAGSKGLGEIAIVGVAAAVANAVFHATGKRIRHLPITPDKILLA